MESYQDEDELFEEDIVFDHAGLLDSNAKTKTAIRRISTGKCALFAKTLGLCGAFFGLGLCIAVPMPGIMDSADQSMAPHSNIYTARSSGYLVGSFIGGVLFDRFNRLFLLFISLLLTSLFITITPWCKILWLLRATMVILGILMGFLDTGCNVLCLDLWGRNSGPFMQALHFSFGLGVFIAPMLSAPFMEVIQLNVSSEVNSSFPQNFHISDPQAENLLKRVFDSNNLKDHSLRVDRDIIHQNESFISNETDFGDVWASGSNHTGFIRVSPTIEIPKLSSSSAVIKSHYNQSDLGLSNENETLVTSVEYSENEVELSTEYANSTRTPSTHTTPRVPKPKPSFTDAGKLDHTKNWDNIRVGKPPPEDLVVPSTVKAKTISQIPTSLAQTTRTSTKASVVTTPASILKTSNRTEYEISNVTTPGCSSLENLQPFEEIKNKSLTEKENNIIGGDKGEIAQKGNNETNLVHKFVVEEGKNVSSNSSTVTQKSFQPAKGLDTSKLNVKSQYLNGSQASFLLPDNKSSTSFPIPTTSMSGSIVQKDPVLTKEKMIHRKGNSSEKTNLKPVDHVIESPLQSAYEAANLTIEKENTARNSEFYGDDEEHKTERVLTPGMVSSPPMNVVHITVHELDKLFQDDEYKFSSDHENSTSNNGNRDQSQLSLSKLFPSEIPPKHEHHFKPGTYDNDTEDISTIFDVFANRIEKYGFNKIQFTYLIVGLFVFSISLVFLGFLCHNPRDPKSKQEDGVGQYKISSKFLWGSLVSCMSLFFCFSVGMELTFGRYLLTFAVHSDLNLSRATGNCVVALFWGSFAAMRFASIFCASGFSPTSMLIFNFFMCSLGSIILSTLSNEVETALWLGTSFLGIGLASMFPTGILWVERYIHVTNQVAAFFVMGVSLGEIVCPIVVQYLMQSNQLMLMHAAAVSNALCICTFVVLWCLVSHRGEKYVSVGNNGYQLANQHDEEEDMVELSPSSNSARVRSHGSPNELGLLLNGHSSYGR